MLSRTALVIVSGLLAAAAPTKPCFDGECAYDIPGHQGSIGILRAADSPKSIADITQSAPHHSRATVLGRDEHAPQVHSFKLTATDAAKVGETNSGTDGAANPYAHANFESVDGLPEVAVAVVKGAANWISKVATNGISKVESAKDSIQEAIDGTAKNASSWVEANVPEVLRIAKKVAIEAAKAGFKAATGR